MSDTVDAKQGINGFKIAVDFGPLLVWMIVNRFFGIFSGVAAFMLAITVALIFSKLVLKRISPMLWMTAVLVIGFGTITLIKQDAYWIQLKPTIVYIIFSTILFFGLLTGKSFIKSVLEYGYTGLDETGWRLLTRNWACFFLFLAVANAVLTRIYPAYPGSGRLESELRSNMDTWLNIKIWGFTGVTMLFTIANIPMLMKHGLGGDAADEK